MSTIKYAILGHLSWSARTGYDLKKWLADTPLFSWSGSSNEIYRVLVELHQDELVTTEWQSPARKVYCLTDKGREELRHWLQSSPELPETRNAFLVRLAWADQLTATELDALVGQYEEEIRVQLLMRQAQEKRTLTPGRSPREGYLWNMILKNGVAGYETELNWVRQLRHELRQWE